MTCDEARKRWHARFDEGAEDAQLDRHLATCDDCRTFANRMMRLMGALDELREETAALTSGDPRTSTKEPVRRSRAIFHHFQAGTFRAAAAVLLVVTAGLYYGNRLTQPFGSSGNGAAPTDLPAPSVVASPQGPEERFGITLQGDSAQRFLAVPRPASQPDVRVFWLYPSVPHSANANAP